MSTEPSSPWSPNSPSKLADETSQMLPTTRPVRSPTVASSSTSTTLNARSPLNPNAPSSTSGSFPIPRSRPASRGSTYLTSRFTTDQHRESSSFAGSDSPYPMLLPQASPFAPGARGSMVLYRLADEPAHSRESTAFSTLSAPLVPPPRLRDSVLSSSGDSLMSVSDRDSKYPADTVRGLVPYAYDPALDELEPIDDEDMLHDPDNRAWSKQNLKKAFPWRGVLNVTVLIGLVAALLCLFIFYPVLTFFRNETRNLAIDGNIRINATGQAPVLFGMPDLIDKDTPENAKTRTGYDGLEYELVFSDEFNVDGRTFYPGEDPFWEGVDLWYGATNDQEWYDPSQLVTRDGALVITMDSVTTGQGMQTPGRSFALPSPRVVQRGGSRAASAWARLRLWPCLGVDVVRLCF
ncbi:hypothetical protein HGRIS_013926 [Hohenbuehelia grisea]|uniref:Uncharacterized protein n=1 Tax=Hohenbuehelia grisea TaxID=104357 RepID=A0ABR3JTT0_9AGAR